MEADGPLPSDKHRTQRSAGEHREERARVREPDSKDEQRIRDGGRRETDPQQRRDGHRSERERASDHRSQRSLPERGSECRSGYHDDRHTERARADSSNHRSQDHRLTELGHVRERYPERHPHPVTARREGNSSHQEAPQVDAGAAPMHLDASKGADHNKPTQRKQSIGAEQDHRGNPQHHSRSSRQPVTGFSDRPHEPSNHNHRPAQQGVDSTQGAEQQRSIADDRYQGSVQGSHVRQAGAPAEAQSLARSDSGAGQQYNRKVEEYDYLVPRSGYYFEHDDRDVWQPRRGGGRGRGRGGPGNGYARGTGNSGQGWQPGSERPRSRERSPHPAERRETANRPQPASQPEHGRWNDGHQPDAGQRPHIRDTAIDVDMSRSGGTTMAEAPPPSRWEGGNSRRLLDQDRDRHPRDRDRDRDRGRDHRDRDRGRDQGRDRDWRGSASRDADRREGHTLHGAEPRQSAVLEAGAAPDRQQWGVPTARDNRSDQDRRWPAASGGMHRPMQADRQPQRWGGGGFGGGGDKWKHDMFEEISKPPEAETAAGAEAAAQTTAPNVA